MTCSFTSIDISECPRPTGRSCKGHDTCRGRERRPYGSWICIELPSLCKPGNPLIARIDIFCAVWANIWHWQEIVSTYSPFHARHCPFDHCAQTFQCMKWFVIDAPRSLSAQNISYGTHIMIIKHIIFFVLLTCWMGIGVVVCHAFNVASVCDQKAFAIVENEAITTPCFIYHVHGDLLVSVYGNIHVARTVFTLADYSIDIVCAACNWSNLDALHSGEQRQPCLGFKIIF